MMTTNKFDQKNSFKPMVVSRAETIHKNIDTVDINARFNVHFIASIGISIALCIVS